MKTIFVSIFDGDTERVILRTGAWDVMRASGHRIVLLVRGADRIDHYRRIFGHDLVAVELLPEANSFWENLWYYVSWNTIPTHAANVRRVREYLNRGKYGAFVLGSIAGLLGSFRVWREFLRYIYRVTGEAYADGLFEYYRPDLLFAANMFSPEDTRLLLSARRRNIRTVSIAKSWDVLTTKAFTRVRADRLLVYNEVNREEAIRFGDYSPKQVIVTGFPQFDIYHGTQNIMPRDVFCRSVGLDPTSRYALYGVPGDWKSPGTTAILSMISDRIEQGVFCKPLQVLARLHPKYRDRSEGLVVPHVVVERPGTYFDSAAEFGIDSGARNMGKWTFQTEDIIHLANSLYHADMVINVDSTLTLDAAANDKPTILIAYDGNETMPYKRSIAFIYEREHYQKVIATGGVAIAHTHDELVASINQFLEDPAALREGRDRLRGRILYAIDGQAGRRVGEAVLDMLP